MRPYLALGAVLFLAIATTRASAETDEATRAARWNDLRGAIFEDRAVTDGSDVVHIDAPARAADAALVPVGITLSDAIAARVRQLYLVIDDNPSPLAAVFHFGPAADRHEVSTRVRVDDYTDMHAIAETEDGTLYVAARFIKASGGCSAPASKDPAEAMRRLGKMKMTLRGTREAGKPVAAELLISHPNSSGMQMDQVTRNYIPADFVRSVMVSYNGETVLSVESDIALSEDPSIGFDFVPHGPGTLKAQFDDSNQRHFEQSWPVPLGSDTPGGGSKLSGQM